MRADGRNGIVVSRSFNGGQTWSRPSFSSGDGVAVVDLSPTSTTVHDKEWAASDLTSGQAYSHTNRIYITWTRFAAGHSPIYEVHSDDGGAHWSTLHAISGSSTLCDFAGGGTTVQPCQDDQPSWPVVGPDGTVYVFFRNVDTPAQNQFLMVKSTDGGATFSNPAKVADVFDQAGTYPRAGSGGTRNRPDCTARGQPSGRMVLSNSCFRVNSYGGPAVAPDGSLYLVWSDNRNGNNVHTDTDIFLTRSTDGGATWGAPIRVNTDGPGSDQFFPWPAVAPDGTVYVNFHDRRDDTTSTVTNFGVPISPAGNYLVGDWMAKSIDGGQTWTNFRVMDVSSNWDFGFRGGIFLGDYNGLAVTNKLAYPFFTDARNGTADVRQSDVYTEIVQPGGH
jgi:Neuraminidase (sialidase)